VSKAELMSKHLAELHALAADAGVPRYRMLRRDELVEELLDRAGAESEDEARVERPRYRPRRAETGEVTGRLEIVRAGHGFLRVEGAEEDADDVYVSASQIRRCELEDGDEVEGPARPPRRGERHRALVRVELVNGEAPPEGPADEPEDELD
jgi:transcription termination factor Rho